MTRWFRSRKGVVLAIQWLLTVVVAVWGATTGAWRASPLVFWSLVALSAVGNAALMRLPLGYFYRPAHWMYVFVADTVFVGAALYCMRGFDTGLYLPYFLIILTAALTRSLARGTLVAAVVFGLYVLLVWGEGDTAGLVDPGFIIRLPFFLIIAIFTGYLAQSARLQQESEAASRALSDQVQELQQLAAGIAHEVRNPLTAIQNNLRAAEGRVAADSAAHRLLEDALDQVSRVSRIVQETLELARPPRLRPAWADVNGTVDRALAHALRDAGGGGIEVRRTAPRGELWAWADAGLLELALYNVLRNSVEAMAGRGRLSVETSAGSGRSGEYVAIRVADTGGGIPPHQLERLYQPFYSTKADGTGLGLCLARKYVRAHGGELTVASPVPPAAPGEPAGTEVRLMLPVAGPPVGGGQGGGGHGAASARR